MAYKRFEELPVWQDAASLAVRIEALCDSAVMQPKPGLRDQLERASWSVSNNIAEGFERGSTTELIAYLYIARGSVAEVRSMLHIMRRLVRFEQFGGEIESLVGLCEHISRQIRGWTNSLQNSEIAGPRHLNDASRSKYERRQRVSALQTKLDRIVQRRVEEQMGGSQQGNEVEGEKRSEI